MVLRDQWSCGTTRLYFHCRKREKRARFHTALGQALLLGLPLQHLSEWQGKRMLHDEIELPEVQHKQLDKEMFELDLVEDRIYPLTLPFCDPEVEQGQQNLLWVGLGAREMAHKMRLLKNMFQ